MARNFHVANYYFRVIACGLVCFLGLRKIGSRWVIHGFGVRKVPQLEVVFQIQKRAER